MKMNLTGHTNQVHALIELPNGDLASGSADETIKIWDLKSVNPLKRTLFSYGCSLAFAVLRNDELVTVHNR
jgi:WD40 repeat protein